MNFTITYMSYEGNVRTTTVEDVNNEDEAVEAAYKSEGNYSGDNIYKIIEIEQD